MDFTKETDRLIDDAVVVVMCGVSGSGKTRFSGLLEHRGFVRLSADLLIWRDYGDGFVSMPAEKRMRAFGDIDKEIALRLSQLVSDGKRVVIDSTMCKFHKREAVRQLCRSLGVEPLIIYLEAEKELLLRRLAVRRGTGPDDQIVSPDQLEMFYDHFETPSEAEKVCVVRQQN